MANESGEAPYNNESTSNSSYNQYFQTATALQIRLNTEPVVRQIEMYLRGRREEVYQDEKDGIIKNRTVYIGKPLINDEGLQWIMNFVETLFNVQVVQGNFEEYDQYTAFLERTRKDLAEHLMINLYDYDIKENNYNGVISTMMRFVETFTSRLIKNKERDSYNNTIRSVESNSLRPLKQGLMSKMPFG